MKVKIRKDVHDDILKCVRVNSTHNLEFIGLIGGKKGSLDDYLVSEFQLVKGLNSRNQIEVEPKDFYDACKSFEDGNAFLGYIHSHVDFILPQQVDDAVKEKYEELMNSELGKKVYLEPLICNEVPYYEFVLLPSKGDLHVLDAWRSIAEWCNVNVLDRAFLLMVSQFGATKAYENKTHKTVPLEIGNF